ncbi:protein ALP1-like [Senna tora]|uniref:Protein ALP1-like n=1 Tax=Senna tora TaxID=362788 RepID=A0A834X6K2_9FABA|nr:protein ALP1-like [Senna tora]
MRRISPRSYTLDFEVKRAHLRSMVYASDVTCYNQIRMNRATFDRLCGMLDDIGGLRPTRNMLVDEQVAIFLHILSHHVKNRVIQFRFGRSGETVKPVADDSTDERWKWFKGCLGALDGTHIRIRVSPEDQPRYRNRKGEITTNVLGVCTRDELFFYVMAGWEGSVADSRVLQSAILKPNGLKVPEGQYYLVAVGFTNGPGFLAPYREQRYHLNSGSSNTVTTSWRHFHWTPVLDEMLVQSVMELFDARQFEKKDSNKKLQQKMAEKCSGCGIKANPHIQSRLKTMKVNWSAVYELANASGFGWDPVLKCVYADDAVWNQYIEKYTHLDEAGASLAKTSMESTEAGKRRWNQQRPENVDGINHISGRKRRWKCVEKGCLSAMEVCTDEGEPVKIWMFIRDNMVFSRQFCTFVAIFLAFHTESNAWPFWRIERIGFLAGIQFRAQQFEPNTGKRREACNSTQESNSALNQT